MTHRWAAKLFEQAQVYLQANEEFEQQRGDVLTTIRVSRLKL